MNMNAYRFLIYLLIMAITTYLIRVIPFTLVRKEINNKFLKSFFTYIPYAVLGAMTFPAILYSTTYMVSALIGMVAAIIVAYFNQGLVKVAVTACVCVLLSEVLIQIM